MWYSQKLKLQQPHNTAPHTVDYSVQQIKTIGLNILTIPKFPCRFDVMF